MDPQNGRLRVAVVEKHLENLKAAGNFRIRPVPYFKPKIRTKRHNPYEDGIRKYELNGRGVYRRDLDEWYYPESGPALKEQPEKCNGLISVSSPDKTAENIDNSNGRIVTIPDRDLSSDLISNCDIPLGFVDSKWQLWTGHSDKVMELIPKPPETSMPWQEHLQTFSAFVDE